jgi:hypothetical protein
MSRDETRRIAANMAKLPELVKKSEAAPTWERPRLHLAVSRDSFYRLCCAGGPDLLPGIPGILL